MSLRRHLIFISGPLTQGDVNENICKAHTAALQLIQAGFSVIVPHDTVFWGNKLTQRLQEAHNYQLGNDVEYQAGFLTEKDIEGVAYETWLENCFEQIKRCSALLRIPGYSPGGDREVSQAQKKGIPVFFKVEEVISYFQWVENTLLGK
jgi:hypothetical protein